MHALVRSILIPDIVKLIQAHYGLDEETAMDLFYSSNTASLFADDEMGLYGQSAWYIFGLFMEEMKQKGLQLIRPIGGQP